MGISDSDIERLFKAGLYAQLLRVTEFDPRTAQAFSATSRAILTQALAWTGELEAAAQIAYTDSAIASPPLIRSQAETVLGFAAMGRGDAAAAADHHQAAIRLARESRSRELVAWSSLYWFRSAIDVSGIADAMALLPAVREAVTAAGHPQASAYLHACVAILEGHAGRLDEAHRHCEIAESLLELAPNARIAALARLNFAGLSILSRDFKEAERHFRSARKLVEQSGHLNAATTLDGNIAHVALFAGKWDRARAGFARVLSSSTHSKWWRPSALEGVARLHLATGELDLCESALSELDEMVKADPALERSYPVRWGTITRARLLWKRGRNTDALLHVESALAKSAAGDRPLTAALWLCRAIATHLVGDDIESAESICAAERLGASRMPQTQPQYYFSLAQIAAPKDLPLCETLKRRARAVWTEQAVVSVQKEMEISGPTPDATTTQDLAPVARVVNCLGALIDLAQHPTALETELRHIIDVLKLSPEDHSRRRAGASVRDVTLAVALGHDADGDVLICRPPTEPVKAILLADVLRIGQAAVELERYRREERNRAALWPADPIETEAGALFLAEEMQTLLATARRVAPTTVPILITGETGTGKEVLARLIHAYSNRAKATFLPFNCSATPKDMLDSQLFGHRRGSFTGATDSFPGVIRAAAGGTLLLDEIGETTLDVQPKLLRFLESGEVHPLGETHPGKTDVRVIAATNADLETLVAAGRFREDLFYRLNIVRLHLPPLRERRVEIPALANHYLRKHAREVGKGDLRLAEETMEYLVLFRWPGNVRQLANEMRRLAALAETGAVLMPEHLSADIFASRKTVPASERTLEPTELVVRLDQPLAAAVQHVERAMILYAMRKGNGGMEQTAALLGLSRKGLYLKRQRYGIDTPGEDAAAVA